MDDFGLVQSAPALPPATTPDHRGQKVLADLKRRRFKRRTSLLLSGMAARSQVRFPVEKRLAADRELYE
jgi:hypothetical protein